MTSPIMAGVPKYLILSIHKGAREKIRLMIDVRVENASVYERGTVENPGTGPRGVFRGFNRFGERARIAFRWTTRFKTIRGTEIWRFWKRKEICLHD